MQNKLYIALMNSKKTVNLDWAEDIRNRNNSNICWNPEEPHCSNYSYAEHQLPDIDEAFRQYPMCKSCYNSWIYN